jgi:uncharacterized protein (TIGR02266 family)
MVQRQQRFFHGGEVRVVAPGISWTGRAVNLSSGGAFISGGPELEAGRRLTLQIDLCDGKAPVAAHAKVAWTRRLGTDTHPAGVGVRFVRIDNESVRRIERLVSLNAQPSRPLLHGPVRVRLPGLPARLRAQGRQAPSGMMVIEAELSWLVLGGTVSLELAPGHLCDGRLAWVGVEVTPSGHARLCLNVEPLSQTIELEAEPDNRSDRRKSAT